VKVSQSSAGAGARANGLTARDRWGTRRAVLVQYRCSSCHLAFDSAEEPETCPRCHAEAGLELQVAVPLAVKLFGALLACLITASLVGGLIGRLAG
jgi:uncharacterized paraquat-inducible protein A